MKTFIPDGYTSLLSIYDTQKAISLLKRLFEDRLGDLLNLYRVSAPLFVDEKSGLNDNLNGVERPVSFDILRSDARAEVVQSLAKWKRLALKRYGFYPGRGIYTDMNAIRRDEDTLDNLHSVYVDQWDWEKIILPENRNLDYLKLTVMDIVEAICDTQDTMQSIYPQLQVLGKIERRVSFISSQELEDMYPGMTAKERENAYTREHGTVFISCIGDRLGSGAPHDGRAPDYDDWSLNGDILVWYDTLGCAMELSSMGIRVDPAALDYQLRVSGCDSRRELPYHKALLAGELPLTIGGGIALERNDLWEVAVDGYYAPFSGLNYVENTDYNIFGSSSLRSAENWRVSLGGEWKGDASASSYWARIGISAGIYHNHGRLTLDVNDEGYCLNESGVGMGFSLPMRKGRSVLTLSMAYSRFGDISLLRRDCFTMGITIGSCERWFVKKKYN